MLSQQMAMLYNISFHVSMIARNVGLQAVVTVLKVYVVTNCIPAITKANGARHLPPFIVNRTKYQNNCFG